MMSFSVRTYKR